MFKIMRVIIVSLFLLLATAWPGFALTPNLPAATLGSDGTVHTRFGTIADGIRSAPPPAVPSPGISGRGIYIIDISVARGLADNVRVFQSSGNKALDDAAIAALMKWRFKPRAFYKLTVPIEFTSPGRVRIGS